MQLMWETHHRRRCHKNTCPKKNKKWILYYITEARGFAWAAVPLEEGGFLGGGLYQIVNSVATKFMIVFLYI
jgi:hypothetical protein